MVRFPLLPPTLVAEPAPPKPLVMLYEPPIPALSVPMLAPPPPAEVLRGPPLPALLPAPLATVPSPDAILSVPPSVVLVVDASMLMVWFTSLTKCMFGLPAGPTRDPVASDAPNCTVSVAALPKMTLPLNVALSTKVDVPVTVSAPSTCKSPAIVVVTPT